MEGTAKVVMVALEFLAGLMRMRPRGRRRAVVAAVVVPSREAVVVVAADVASVVKARVGDGEHGAFS